MRGHARCGGHIRAPAEEPGLQRHVLLRMRPLSKFLRQGSFAMRKATLSTFLTPIRALAGWSTNSARGSSANALLSCSVSDGGA